MQTEFILKKAENKKYYVTVIDKKNKKTDGKDISYSDSSHFYGFLIQLKGQYFFDCTPDTEIPQFDRIGEETKSALLPVHLIYKIGIVSKGQLSIAGINIDSLRKFIGKDRNMVKHENPDKDHVLLTADPVGLQKKILTNKEAGFVFGETEILYRIK